ncbi:MAG: prephenate dehydratase [Candidatus Omnitrophica bacterium CG11_big_fil_rev_8_21_14_0_20_43_6]|nr:MAG: prephenate dehydratase [Candidatus Omnitrophica bacterium CG11_big_fil_rev_8_21_14_0_20_43_6]
MSLNKLRKKIDLLDKKLINLLNLRAAATKDIGKIKINTSKKVYVPEREMQVLNRISSLNKGPLKKSALEAIYREVMSASLALEKPLKIAYLGPQASFTNLAAIKKFGSQVSYVACNSIADVFLEVEKDSADYGVVPIENSIEGAVSHTLDVFVDSDLKICSQVILEVTHNLLANCAKNKIRYVYSNPQVFGQCRIWLQKNLPNAQLIDVSSTTRAAEMAKKEKNSAAIASLLASEVYGLKVLASGIQDSAHNITRFLVVGKNVASRTGQDKTSLFFSIKDRVGALYEMLLPFRKYGVNLTKIESRPSKKKAWEYYFFVDILGHQDDVLIKKALNELERKCSYLKILGSYPTGE